MSTHPEVRDGVNGHDALEALRLEVEERAILEDTRVVHQDIDRSHLILHLQVHVALLPLYILNILPFAIAFGMRRSILTRKLRGGTFIFNFNEQLIVQTSLRSQDASKV